MAYTTLAQIKSMFRGIDIIADTGDEATNTVITEEEVTQFITDADIEIDAKLNEYYVTPITGTESLKYINVISKYKVAHIMKTILEAQSENSDRQQDVQTNLGKKADELLNALLPKIVNGKFVDALTNLSDAPRQQKGPDSGTVFGINYSGVRTPTFKKGGDNW